MEAGNDLIERQAMRNQLVERQFSAENQLSRLALKVYRSAVRTENHSFTNTYVSA